MKSIVTTKDEVRHFRRLLDHTDKWYLDFSCPDTDDHKEITEKAREYATLKLRAINVNALYQRFLKWEKSDAMIRKSYYYSFLDDITFDMGCEALKGEEREMFFNDCSLTIKFL